MVRFANWLLQNVSRRRRNSNTSCCSSCFTSKPLELHTRSIPREDMRVLIGHRHFRSATYYNPMGSFWSGSIFATPSRRQIHLLTTTTINQVHKSPKRFLPPRTFRLDDISRSFASSRRGQKGAKRNTAKESKAILANEDLIARLIRDADGASSDKINVRLVIDEGPNNPSTVQVTTLTNAVQISLERNVDLIAASLDNDPPVVRLAELSKLQYKAEQAQKKQQQQAAANKKEKKSFRFKAGIDSHDLERKVAQLKGYLQKGSDCDYTVFARARTLRENANAGMELVDEIQALIGDDGVLKRAPETNETNSFYRVQLEPKR